VQVYTSLAQFPVYMQPRPGPMALLARASIDPDALTASIRREVSAIDPDIPVYNVQTMRSYLAQSTEQPRLNVVLLGAFGILALLLAVVGIYGVMSYAVVQRTQEIGVRLALGASAGAVLRLIVGHGMALAGIGIAIGLGASWAVTKWLGAMLFAISPHDPLTFATLAMLLAIVAFVASYVPGRRATRVDPVVTLRADG
jgi:putative ABC transport system permease protein